VISQLSFFFFVPVDIKINEQKEKRQKKRVDKARKLALRTNPVWGLIKHTHSHIHAHVFIFGERDIEEKKEKWVQTKKKKDGC
jgi:hypothetical protein